MLKERLDKETYIGIVKFTLESMLKQSKEDRTYNLQADTIHYYEAMIKAEDILSLEEFLGLCKEVGIK